MTPKRPQRLVFIGNRFPDGRPERYLEGVPADDLNAEQTDALTQEQLTTIRASGLYREVAKPEPKKSGGKKKAAPNQPTAQPEVTGDTESTDVGDEPNETAETVTQGGES